MRAGVIFLVRADRQVISFYFLLFVSEVMHLTTSFLSLPSAVIYKNWRDSEVVITRRS